MDSVLWILVALGAWWIGAAASGVRRELRRLEEGRLPDEDYSLVSLLRRLQDDSISLALRIRLSRIAASVFLPLGLVAAGPGRSGVGLALATGLGWLLAAAAEASGGGVLARRLGRMRGGAGYAAWARFTQPWSRVARPLVELRISRFRENGRQGLVLAESRASLLSSGSHLGREERRFLRRLLASNSILVTDILTRWENVHAVDLTADPGEAARIIRGSGHSRLPVLDGGRVAGLITARDLVFWMHGSGSGGTLASMLRPVYFVREEVTVQELLNELQEARVHLAVVLDRLGRQVGIVTMEDVLEEIVGEIHDEREREANRS